MKSLLSRGVALSFALVAATLFAGCGGGGASAGGDASDDDHPDGIQRPDRVELG